MKGRESALMSTQVVMNYPMTSATTRSPLVVPLRRRVSGITLPFVPFSVVDLCVCACVCLFVCVCVCVCVCLGVVGM